MTKDYATDREYRQALGRIPTCVAFVSARAPDGEAAGLLINSFTPVSLVPRALVP